MNFNEQLTTKSDHLTVAFFLMHPPRTFSFTEIKDILRISAKELQKSLDKLLALKLVAKFTKSDHLLYIIKDVPSELKVVSFDLRKKYPNKDKVLALLKGLKGLEFAILGGVLVAERSHEVDLVLVGDFDPKKAREVVMYIERLYGFDLQFCIFDPTEFELRLAALDVFLRNIVESKHMRFEKGALEFVKK